MAEEIGLADLETAQMNLAQNVSAHVKKREAFELKFQEEISSVATNINGKLDDLIKSLDSIQVQLHNFGKGKRVDDVRELGPIAGGSSGSILEEICNKSQQSPKKGLQIEQNGEETLKHISQELDYDYRSRSEPLLLGERVDKITQLFSSNIKNKKISPLEITGAKAQNRDNGIGVPFLAKNRRDEAKCKISQSPHKSFISRLGLGFSVVSNDAENWSLPIKVGLEIDLRRNIGSNISQCAKSSLSESFVENGIFLEKLVKEKVHICSAKSTTTKHFIDKLGSTDKRFLERFKKEAVGINARLFGYVMKEEYAAFCDGLAIHWEERLVVKHILVDELLDFKAILFVPTRAHFGLLNIGNKSNKVELYFLLELIMGSWEELMPEYLSFVMSIGDSGDLPLDISHGELQPNETLKVIRKNSVKKFIELFSEIAQNIKSNNKYYKAFSNDFMIGSDTYEDFYNYEKIVKLLSFYPTKNGDEMTTLIDKEGKRLLFATKEGLKLNESEDKEKRKREQKEELVVRCTVIKNVIVNKVVVLYWVVDSLCCLVIREYGWTANMKRIMMAQSLRYSIFTEYMLSKRKMQTNYVTKWKNIIDDFVVTIVRVWVEFGLLTQACMYQIRICIKKKDMKSKDVYDVAYEQLKNQLIWLEILVDGICCCCIMMQFDLCVSLIKCTFEAHHVLTLEQLIVDRDITIVISPVYADSFTITTRKKGHLQYALVKMENWKFAATTWEIMSFLEEIYED